MASVTGRSPSQPDLASITIQSTGMRTPAKAAHFSGENRPVRPVHGNIPSLREKTARIKTGRRQPSRAYKWRSKLSPLENVSEKGVASPPIRHTLAHGKMFPGKVAAGFK